MVSTSVRHVALSAMLALALSPTTVLAADLWNRPAPQRFEGSVRPIAPIWSGLYVGGHIGSGFPDIRAKGYGSSNFAGDALAGGLYAGYNFATGPWVTGVEFDATWSGMEGRRTFGATTITTEADFLASARARIGYAQSFWHIYLTGGLAFGDVTTRFTTGGASAADSSWRTGFVWGGGIEAKADTRVSLRLEALHYDLGSETARTSVASSRVEADVTTVRAGVTFHFN